MIYLTTTAQICVADNQIYLLIDRKIVRHNVCTRAASVSTGTFGGSVICILIDYAEQNGIEIIGKSYDDNVSGMTFEREGLNQLEDAVMDGKVDVVLAKNAYFDTMHPLLFRRVHFLLG